jgi:hypothetical protein
MLAVLSMVALLAVQPSPVNPQDFSKDLPAGFPDMSGWSQVESTHTGTLKRPKGSKAEFPLADMAIRMGLCPDTDKPCEVTVSCRSQIVMEEEIKTGDWVMRWTLTTKDKRAEGIIRHILLNGEPGAVFWIRDGTSWKVVLDPDEFRATFKFGEFLFQFLLMTHQEGQQ